MYTYSYTYTSLHICIPIVSSSGLIYYGYAVNCRQNLIIPDVYSHTGYVHAISALNLPNSNILIIQQWPN